VVSRSLNLNLRYALTHTKEKSTTRVKKTRREQKSCKSTDSRQHLVRRFPARGFWHAVSKSRINVRQRVPSEYPGSTRKCVFFADKFTFFWFFLSAQELGVVVAVECLQVGWLVYKLRRQQPLLWQFLWYEQNPLQFDGSTLSLKMRHSAFAIMCLLGMLKAIAPSHWVCWDTLPSENLRKTNE